MDEYLKIKLRGVERMLIVLLCKVIFLKRVGEQLKGLLGLKRRSRSVICKGLETGRWTSQVCE